MSTSTPASSDAIGRLTSTTLARRALVAAVLGLGLTVLARIAAVALDPSLTGVEQFGWMPVVTVTLVSTAGAALVYAALDRFTARPARWFLVVAGAVFLVMLVPLTLGAAALDLTGNARFGLGVLHLTAAVGIVAGVLGADRLAR
jgi:hypothetical protein